MTETGGAASEAERLERAVKAAQAALDLAADGWERAASAHDELARVQREAAQLEHQQGSQNAAAARRRASKRATNDATAERVRAAYRRQPND